MPDISHVWGGDLGLGPTGDLALVDGTVLGTQRVIRRLMTAANRRDSTGMLVPGEYVFHMDYGGSVNQRIGDNVHVAAIAGALKRQMMAETAVAKTPAPVINITPAYNGVQADIAYNDAVTGRQTFLQFSVT